jgi:predicted GNAT family N-acyltransferase
MKRFEDKSISRSYLILDRKNNDNENFYILGFFSLSLKALYVDQKKLTRRQKKDMNLLKDQDVIPSYFVGQLGKNDMFKCNFKGEYLLNEAVNIIYQCIEMLGGTIVWLEANKEAGYVVKFYKDRGFIELQSELQEDRIERIQMIKYLNRE